MGSTEQKSGKHSVILGRNLADNNWHLVKVKRQRHDLTIALDAITNTSTIPGYFVKLDLDRFIFVGGVDKLSERHHGVDSVLGFVGCLRDVVFDSIDFLYGARENLLDYKTHGSLVYSCPSSNYIPVSFPTPDSRLVLSYKSITHFSVRLSFRSYEGDGILVAKRATNARVLLKLSSGQLQLDVHVSPDKPIKISVGEGLHDGMWHDVTAGVNAREMWLLLDDKPEVRHSNPWLTQVGNFWSALNIAYDTRNSGFVGCMNNISINGEAVNLRHLNGSSIVDALVNQCKISSRCFPNPCLNGGKCLQTWEEYRCNCRETFHTGPRCEAPLYRATCEQYRRLGMTQDAFCKVGA